MAGETLPNGWQRDLYSGPVAREDLSNWTRRLAQARRQLHDTEKQLELAIARAGAYGGLGDEEIFYEVCVHGITSDKVWKLIEEEKQKMKEKD